MNVKLTTGGPRCNAPERLSTADTCSTESTSTHMVTVMVAEPCDDTHHSQRIVQSGRQNEPCDFLPPEPLRRDHQPPLQIRSGRQQGSWQVRLRDPCSSRVAGRNVATLQHPRRSAAVAETQLRQRFSA